MKELSVSTQTRHAPSRFGTEDADIFIQSGKSPFRSSSQAAGPVPLRTTFESIVPDSQSVSDVHITESAEAAWGRVMTRTTMRSATEKPMATNFEADRISNPFPQAIRSS